MPLWNPIMISKLISNIKGDESYRMDSKYSYLELLIILWERGVQIVRGIIAKVFLVRAKGLFFQR